MNPRKKLSKNSRSVQALHSVCSTNTNGTHFVDMEGLLRDLRVMRVLFQSMTYGLAMPHSKAWYETAVLSLTSLSLN